MPLKQLCRILLNNLYEYNNMSNFVKTKFRNYFIVRNLLIKQFTEY